MRQMTGICSSQRQDPFRVSAAESHDALGSQIDRASSRAHFAPSALCAYRVNFRDGNEMTAYYTDNLEDAVKTAVEMARTRDVTHAVDEAVAVEIRRRPGRK